MNIRQANSNCDAPRAGHHWLLAALALLICTPRVVADCPCDINVAQGTTVNILGDVTADCMKVDGTLNIVDGTLTLTGKGCGTSKIDGTVNLHYTSPLIFGSLAFVDNDHVLKGDGKIDGANALCRIWIGSGQALTNHVTIEGILDITDATSSGTFANGDGGLVHADAGGTLRINTTTLGAGGGDWQVSHGSGTLQFSVGSSSLSGDFTVSAGFLDVDADVCTTGDLTFDGGTIDVAAGKSFKAGGSCP